MYTAADEGAARDATPVSTAINAPQYTATITWQTGDGAAHTGPFAAATVYRALVTLSAKTSYTFTGVGANALPIPAQRSPTPRIAGW